MLLPFVVAFLVLHRRRYWSTKKTESIQAISLVCFLHVVVVVHDLLPVSSLLLFSWFTSFIFTFSPYLVQMEHRLGIPCTNDFRLIRHRNSTSNHRNMRKDRIWQYHVRCHVFERLGHPIQLTRSSQIPMGMLPNNTRYPNLLYRYFLPPPCRPSMGTNMCNNTYPFPCRNSHMVPFQMILASWFIFSSFK